jgi:hypothetical protein
MQSDQGIWNASLQFDNMGVPQKLEVLNLSFDSACHIQTRNFLSVDNLQGNLLTGYRVNGHCKTSVMRIDRILSQEMSRELANLHFTFPNEPTPMLLIRLYWPMRIRFPLVDDIV